MTYQLRHHHIDHGPTVVFAHRSSFRNGTSGYIRPSTYIKQRTRVWSVIGTPLNHDMMKHADHFLQGAHAAAWLKELTKKGDTLDEQTWKGIQEAAPHMLDDFRQITGHDWKPAATQAGLFAKELIG